MPDMTGRFAVELICVFEQFQKTVAVDADSPSLLAIFDRMLIVASAAAGANSLAPLMK